jgi:hypothetical protein
VRAKPAPATPAPRITTPGSSAKAFAVVETKPAVERQSPSPAPAAAASATAFLTLGAKPPCSVLVNGEDTGRTTPIRDLEVKSGPVAVTLVNSEFGIRESFTVTVAPGENKKVIKDFSDRLPK